MKLKPYGESLSTVKCCFTRQQLFAVSWYLTWIKLFGFYANKLNTFYGFSLDIQEDVNSTKYHMNCCWKRGKCMYCICNKSEVIRTCVKAGYVY